MNHKSPLISPYLEKLVDWKRTDRPPGQRSQWLWLFNFAHFFILWSPLPFSVEIPNFWCSMPREFWFLVEIWSLSKYMSIWCIWHEIHAIRRYIHQEFIKQTLDHKEITSSCLLIPINCSSLRGFVKMSANWSLVLTNSSVMSPFCAWSLRKWCLISICLVARDFFIYLWH